ncbi:MAG: HPr kinase/phosphorylase [Alphaproteobacteria bacterium]
MKNIHASCVVFKGKGIMFIGSSGSGKSTSCFRLISEENAVLLADDRIDLFVEENKIFASCPQNIEGLLEIYGIGIREFPYIKTHKIDLVIELVKDISEIERLPEDNYYEFSEIKLPQYKMLGSDITLVNKLKVLL